MSASDTIFKEILRQNDTDTNIGKIKKREIAQLPLGDSESYFSFDKDISKETGTRLICKIVGKEIRIDNRKRELFS